MLSSDPLSAFCKWACCIVEQTKHSATWPKHFVCELINVLVPDAAAEAHAVSIARQAYHEFGERMAERFLRKRNSKGKLYLRISLKAAFRDVRRI